jgi:hypothetical protein
MERITRAGRVRTRATVLTCGAAVAAASLLAFAGAAAAKEDPLKGGTTTVKLKGAKAVDLNVTGGSFDPTTGTGVVENAGSLTLEKNGEKVKLTGIVATFGGSFKAKVGKGKAKTLGQISGGTVGRAGFGGTVTGAKIKLTKKGAKTLNKALDTSSYKKGKKLGKADTSTVPSKVSIVSGASETTEAIADPAACIPTNNCPYAIKLLVNGIAHTESEGATFVQTGPTSPPVVSFTPQTGGSIAPDCSDGTLTGSAGKVTFTRATSILTQANPNDEFGNKDVSFDATSTLVGSPGNPGPLGRAPATVLDLSGANCAADPADHKITITNVVQRINPAAASVANQTFGLTGTGCAPGNCPLAGGDLVGTTKYDITTQ